MPLLLVNFKLNVSTDEYRKICEFVAQAIADIPGLVWKIWLLNDQNGEAGAIYLFQDEKSLATYLSCPIIAQTKHFPQLRDISAKRFDTIQELTAITRGPIPELTTKEFSI